MAKLKFKSTNNGIDTYSVNILGKDVDVNFVSEPLQNLNLKAYNPSINLVKKDYTQQISYLDKMLTEIENIGLSSTQTSYLKNLTSINISPGLKALGSAGDSVINLNLDTIDLTKDFTKSSQIPDYIKTASTFVHELSHLGLFDNDVNRNWNEFTANRDEIFFMNRYKQKNNTIGTQTFLNDLQSNLQNRAKQYNIGVAKK